MNFLSGEKEKNPDITFSGECTGILKYWYSTYVRYPVLGSWPAPWGLILAEFN